MANIIKLGTDSRGHYQRDIGWEEKPSGKIGQHRFYFGTDRAAAQLRCLNVLHCWDAVEARWNRTAREERSERPLWDKLTVQIALAVARGQEEYPLEACQWEFYDETRLDASGLLGWFAKLRQDFPMIRFRKAGDWPNDPLDTWHRRNRELDQKAQQAMKSVEEALARLGYPVVGEGPTLHQALDAFSAWHGEHYRTPEGQPTHHATVCQKQIAIIKQHAKDVSLQSFGLEEIEALIRCWQQRPASKAHASHGQPVSRETAKNMIKRIRHFIRWLHKSSAFSWRKPLDYEPEHVRIPVTAAEKSKKLSPTQVKTYGVGELATLWRYASPKERLLMVLALNCGYGQAEIATLQQAEVHTNQAHGHYPISGSFIKAVRLKSGVYGEWKLWDMTERGLCWWAGQRPQTAETALIVTKSGKTLSAPTKGNNRNGRIPSAWAGLTKRIRKDLPSFPRLSFNKLRKTAGNLIRQAAGGEVAGVFLCHGQPVKTDDLAELYTDRPFEKVFEALAAVREKLAPVFDTVAGPFPEDGRKRNPSISLAVREQVVAMRKEGRQYKDIAAACGVSVDTVRRYLTEAGMVRRSKTAHRTA